MKSLKVVFDYSLAIIAIIILSPIMIFAAIGIKLNSKGPILYKAKRAGKENKLIVVYKFRTMKVGADKEGAITSSNDKRIFPFGDLLRKTKIDELPQLFNVLEGTMSIIGPRPEDTDIVERYYTKDEMRTLTVLPGLASPGSIFNYTHGDLYLKEYGTDDAYGSEYLHIKLALDLYYIDHWSLWYDVRLIVKTIYVIMMITLFTKQFDYPVEYKACFGTGK